MPISDEELLDLIRNLVRLVGSLQVSVTTIEAYLKEQPSFDAIRYTELYREKAGLHLDAGAMKTDGSQTN
jgi:hypothetical protein